MALLFYVAETFCLATRSSWNNVNLKKQNAKCNVSCISELMNKGTDVSIFTVIIMITVSVELIRTAADRGQWKSIPWTLAWQRTAQEVYT